MHEGVAIIIAVVITVIDRAIHFQASALGLKHMHESVATGYHLDGSLGHEAGDVSCPIHPDWPGMPSPVLPATSKHSANVQNLRMLSELHEMVQFHPWLYRNDVLA